MTKIATDIPLLSIKAQNAALAGEIKEAVNRVIDSGAFILGPENAAFDLEFAAAVGAPFCLGVDSGTSALELSLEAVGVARATRSSCRLSLSSRRRRRSPCWARCRC